MPLVNEPKKRFARCAGVNIPAGHASVGIARAHGYGARFGEYVAEANEKIAVLVRQNITWR